MSAIGRRTLLAGGAVSLLPCVPAIARARRTASGPDLPDIQPGVQLFPLAARLRADLDSTLSALAAIGFRQVEMAGLPGVGAAAFRAALDRHGLVCRSMHVPAQPWKGVGVSLERDFDQVVADAHAIGAESIVMPLFLLRDRFDAAIWPDSLAFLRAAGAALRLEDWQRTAAFLTATGSRLAAHGLGLAYHNHNFEFARLPDGRSGLDVLMAGTDAAIVGYELDVGWAAAAGMDVADLLTAHPGRFRDMHVKDVTRASKPNTAMEQTPADLGAGAVNWRRVLASAVKAGVRGFYVERDPPFGRDVLSLLADDHRYLTTLTAHSRRR